MPWAVSSEVTLPPGGPRCCQLCPTQGVANKRSSKMLEARCNQRRQEKTTAKKDVGPAEIALPGPTISFPTRQVTPSPKYAARDRSSWALVGGAFRHDNEVDATVGFFLALFLRSFASTRGDARGVHTLLDDVLLGEIGASLRKLRGLRFLAVREANDNELGIGIVFQAQSNVIAHALASIVKAGCASFVITAVAGLCRLRRWRWLLHVDVG